jgi:hypothetical protein
MRRHLTAFGLYLLIALIITYPLAFQLDTALAGFIYGDGRQEAHHLWWFGEALRTGQNPFFMSNLAYPNGIDAITLWATPLQFLPAWALTPILPLTAAANLSILLTMALNGWAMAYLGWSLGMRGGAGLIAGVVFMCFPLMQAHLGAGHAGLLAQYPVPLYALALLRLDRGGVGRIALAAAAFALTGLGHTLQILYVTAPLTLVIVMAALWRRAWATATRQVIAAGIGAAALAIYLLPMVGAVFGSGYAEEGGVVRYSADLLAFASPSFFHPLWGALLDYPRRVLGTNLDEGAAYIGVIAGALALIGVIRRREARLWLGLALLAYLLSLGGLLKIFDTPVQFTTDNYLSYVALPWGILAELPGLSLLRAPGRFNFGLALALAVMAGYGVDSLLNARAQGRKDTPPRVFASLRWVVLAALIAFDYQTFFPLPTTPAAIPPAIAALASRTDIRAVFGIPWDNLIAAKTDLYLHTAHRRPLLAGQVTRRTPVSPAMLTILQDTLDPALLDAAGVDLVIVHKEHDDGALYARALDRLGAPTYEDDALALFEPPDPDAPTAFASVLPDPFTVTARSEVYLYAAEPGWALFEADARADHRRTRLLIDGEAVYGRIIGEVDRLRLPIPLEAGYTTLTVALSPPCPAIIPSAALVCRDLRLKDAALTFTADDMPPAPAVWDRGVSLARWRVTHEGETLSAWLDWRFDGALDENDIRFVHLLDESGGLIAQSDTPLGRIAAGSRRVESVDLALPAGLAPGTYALVTGWYRYPEIVRFRLISAPTETANDVFPIGELVIR